MKQASKVYIIILYTQYLKSNNKDYNIEWSMIARAKAYNNRAKRCNLCLTEKLCIINANSASLVNKRNELISKCRHENTFYIKIIRRKLRNNIKNNKNEV